MRFLPLFFDTSSGVFILVGSGEAALAKLRLLRAAGAHVRWFSCSIDVAEELSTSPGKEQLEISVGDPLKADLSDVVAIVSAAGDLLDHHIAARARRQRIPVNVVDRPDLSTFIFPAIVDRGEVVVAIGTGGASPVLAQRLRERIEALLPTRIGELAELIGRHRGRFAAVPRGLSPRRFWQNVIAGPIAEAVLAGRSVEAEAQLAAAIEASKAGSGGGSKTETVFVVGAGPGDPDLLTLRALHVLADADVVFYDELVTAGVLDRARRDAERVFVGKRRGEPGIGQDEINRRLVEAARAGRGVVRLKGGDPFMFGRGGEELEHLRRSQCPGDRSSRDHRGARLRGGSRSAADLPQRGLAADVRHRTSRGGCRSSRLVGPRRSGRRRSSSIWGLRRAAAVRDGLIAAGRDPATPAAVLRAARGRIRTRPSGASTASPALAAGAGEGPAILVIGDVVARSAPWRAAEVAALIAREAA